MKRIFPYVVLISSLTLAASAAYYSVFGISKLFSAQAFAVAIMAGSLEVAKLITATYLHRYWEKLNILFKTYLTSAVIILMFITSLGIYGFLTAAYQTTANELFVMDRQIAVIEMKKERFQNQLTGYIAEKNQLASSISELTKGLSNNKIQYRDKITNQIITTTSSSTRRVLASQLNDMKKERNTVSIKIEKLTDSITSYDLNILDIESNSTVTAEIGPLKYVSELVERPMNQVVNWFILIFIFVFDPLAVVLLIAANKAFDITSIKTKENIYGESVEVKSDLMFEDAIASPISDTNDFLDQEAENRMNIIGQNGNDGLHYENNDDIPPPPQGPTGQSIT